MPQLVGLGVAPRESPSTGVEGLLLCEDKRYRAKITCNTPSLLTTARPVEALEDALTEAHRRMVDSLWDELLGGEGAWYVRR